jgi:hypothetical protein
VRDGPARLWAGSAIVAGGVLVGLGLVAALFVLVADPGVARLFGARDPLMARIAAAAALVLAGIVAGTPLVLAGEMLLSALDQRRLLARLARRLERAAPSPAEHPETRVIAERTRRYL